MRYIYLLCTFKIQKEKGALEEDEKKGEKVYLPFETSYNEKGRCSCFANRATPDSKIKLTLHNKLFILNNTLLCLK